MLNKATETEFKARFQSSTSIREMNTCCYKGQKPNKKEKTSKPPKKEYKAKPANHQPTTLLGT